MQKRAEADSPAIVEGGCTNPRRKPDGLNDPQFGVISRAAFLASSSVAVALGAWAIVFMAPRGIPVAAVLAGAGIAGALVARSKSSKHYEQVTSFWGIVLNGVALVVAGIRGLGSF